MGNQILQVQRPRKIRINGFIVDPSQLKLAKWIFQTYPETAENVKVQNQKLKNTYMKLLCGNIKTLYHTPLRKITEDELSKACKDLSDLTQAGFTLDWLESKVDKISSEKKSYEERIVELKQEVKQLKLTVSDLKGQRKKEEAKLKKRPSWIQVG
ncbi:MATH domain and coiled-coil domain-containing protein [Cardamine amara subsp. amara]|uniref:MATH domain and coiled-coil domain-containing protein n=1 Tax=Cardamine amara subsp. amara TaxID=228776 RepID=A0ABD0ZZY8_CARAN